MLSCRRDLLRIVLVEREQFQSRRFDLCVDLIGLHVGQVAGFLGEDGQTGRRHVRKAAAHVDAHFHDITIEHADNAVLQRRHERRVVCQHAELAFRARSDHVIDGAREKLPGGRDEREVQLFSHLSVSLDPGAYEASAIILAALAFASSILPTM